MRCFFIGGDLRGNGWTGNERGVKRGLHPAVRRENVVWLSHS